MGLPDAVRNAEGRPMRAHERRFYSVPMAANSSTLWVEARLTREPQYLHVFHHRTESSSGSADLGWLQRPPEDDAWIYQRQHNYAQLNEPCPVALFQ